MAVSDPDRGTILANRVTFLPRPPGPRFPDTFSTVSRPAARAKQRPRLAKLGWGFQPLAGHHKGLRGIPTLAARLLRGF